MPPRWYLRIITLATGTGFALLILAGIMAAVHALEV